MKITLKEGKLIIDGEGDTLTSAKQVEFASKMNTSTGIMECGFITIEGIECEIKNFIFINKTTN